MKMAFNDYFDEESAFELIDLTGDYITIRPPADWALGRAWAGEARPDARAPRRRYSVQLPPTALAFYCVDRSGWSTALSSIIEWSRLLCWTPRAVIIHDARTAKRSRFMAGTSSAARLPGGGL